ncbi:GEMI8 protein, partial [Alcedo cyanopectus]|nr:GEMI8 protein [Ceyx cyanopectus]
LSLSPMFCSQDYTQPWYSMQAYSRYWKHYDLAMRWMRRHQRAYRKAMEFYYNFYKPWHPSASSASTHYSGWEGSNPPQTHRRSPSYAPRGRAPQRGGARWHPGAPQGREDADRDSEMEEDSESEGELEYDLSNMEITEELREFFAQTERHREELRRQQQLEAEQKYVADQDLHKVMERSVEPPTERPGERRMAEMKKLYGAEAAKIQAMEAAMQLIFDRNCDKKQPKYWPIIPLKL